MIDYDNANQFRLLLTISGSVLPSCLPVGISTFLFGLVLAIRRELYFPGLPWLPYNDYIVHEFAVQTVAVVVGYLLVLRTNIALERWMDGISEIQVMLSKWADAYSTLSGFFSGRPGPPEEHERILLFRVRVAHWFSLMSCLAFATLRSGGRLNSLDEVPIKELFADEFRLKKAKSFTTTRRHGSFSASSWQLGSEPDGSERDSCSRDTRENRNKAKREEKELRGKARREETLIGDLDLYVLAAPTPEEISLLEMATDKVNTVCLWIVQGIISEARAGFLDAPPPIVTRTFQELSSGMLGFNQAHKVAMVPFPFPFAQMVGVLLTMLYIALPVYIDIFTRNLFVTPLISLLLPLCYCGLNRIAIELEEPFGTDLNDVDIDVRHEEFLWLLVDVLRQPMHPPISEKNVLELRILRHLAKHNDRFANEIHQQLNGSMDASSAANDCMNQQCP